MNKNDNYGAPSPLANQYNPMSQMEMMNRNLMMHNRNDQMPQQQVPMKQGRQSDMVLGNQIIQKRYEQAHKMHQQRIHRQQLEQNKGYGTHINI